MRNNFVLQLIYIFMCSLICRLAFHEPYSLPSVLKSSDVNEKNAHCCERQFWKFCQ